MKRSAVALLVCVALLGCQPRVIDALLIPGGTAGAGSGSSAGTGGATPDAGPTRSALSYYSLDEGTGSAVHDDSGHAHDGWLLGGTWTDAGRFGSALRFAGASDGVVVDPFPQPVKDWSVSFWLLVESSDLSDISTVLSTEITFAGGWEVNVQPKDATFGNLEFAYWGGSQYDKASCDCVVLGAWNHIVAVVDGSALTIQLFQDGVATASASAPDKFIPGNPYLYLGRWGGSGRPLLGVLDEVAIFDRALSAADVAQLYAGVVP
jgi:hypothetical protein